ncbi:MAG: 30S ribosomal protein S8 [Candidatus Eisenbacteria sp.]|nr:30S ribosomal protein S8 [Candidatus Eisenbacteria bacterium]
MTMTDPIADMLTRIRNASRAKRRKVDIPASNAKKAIASVLLRHKFIGDFKVIEDGPQGTIQIHLKYTSREESVIVGLKRVSTPGRRVYVGKDEIPRVRGGLGTAILSTSRGILAGRESEKEGVGGEVLCYVW